MKTTNLFKRIKYSIQRMRKGYCDYDVFAINHWLLRIMPQNEMICNNNVYKRGLNNVL